MAGINACATRGTNLGKAPCDVRMARPKYIFPTRGKVFTAAELADPTTFKAALKAALLQVRTSNDKIFQFPLMRVADDNTAEVSPATLADGYEEILNESLPLYNLQSTATVCVNTGMTSFNGWNEKVFVLDVNNVWWYVSTSDNGGAGFTVGSLYTDPPRFGNSSNIKTSNTRLLFGDLDEFKEGLGAIKLDFNPAKLIEPINDVTLVEKAAAAANVFTVGGIIKCAGTDIFSKYSAALANSARWTIKNLTTGAAIAITSVAADAVNAGWDITADNTAYTGLASGTKLEINIADPATLNTAGVNGIEGISIVYTKP